MKTVHDPIHGGIAVDGVFLDLLNRHEMQRLRSIKQLGLSCLVFPGANHTRFEHSLGTFCLAGRMCAAMGLSAEDSDAVRAAAMLHDICHPPFSHTMEPLLGAATGCDHMELSRRLIMGDIPSFLPRDEKALDGCEPIGAILEGAGIDPGFVCDLIMKPLSDTGGLDAFADVKGQSYFPSKDYAHQIIHGPVDADQMDYLMRDAHYTGVNHGAIDIERILAKMRAANGQAVLERGAVSAAEGLMVSRSLMYSAVYYHKTVKIVEAMLRRAAELSGADLSSLYLMGDHDLLSRLLSAPGRPSELASMVLRRDLCKKAYIAYSVDLGEGDREMLSGYATAGGRRTLEERIADAAGADAGDVIVDMPSKSVLLSKVRIGKTDVPILDGGRIRSVTRYSSVAKALQAREPVDWAVMVSAPRGCAEAVGAAAARVLSFDHSDGA